jgi:hypothetical protein
VAVLLLGQYISFTQEIHSQIPHATLQVIIVWIASVIISYSTSITTLNLNATCNKVKFLIILSNISNVGSKTLNGHLKKNIHNRGRRSIILQWVVLVLLLEQAVLAPFILCPELHS